MPLEKEAYRDNLERIIERYPGKEVLTVDDVTKFTGLSRPTVKNLYPFKHNYISIATLARELS